MEEFFKDILGDDDEEEFLKKLKKLKKLFDWGLVYEIVGKFS
jgi:hypothetical protein